MKVLITLVAMIVLFISAMWVQESTSEIDPRVPYGNVAL